MERESETDRSERNEINRRMQDEKEGRREGGREGGRAGGRRGEERRGMKEREVGRRGGKI